MKTVPPLYKKGVPSNGVVLVWLRGGRRKAAGMKGSDDATTRARDNNDDDGDADITHLLGQDRDVGSNVVNGVHELQQQPCGARAAQQVPIISYSKSYFRYHIMSHETILNHAIPLTQPRAGTASPPSRAISAQHPPRPTQRRE